MPDAHDPTEDHDDGADQVVVYAGDQGLVGYVIRTDAVLVLEAGVELPAQVVIDGQHIEAIAAFPPDIVDPETPEPADIARSTALQLPDGTIAVPGEQIPPGIDLPIDPEPGKGHGARRSMWCWFFPRLRGC